MAQLELDRADVGASVERLDGRGVPQLVQIDVRHAGVPLEAFKPGAQTEVGEGRAVDGPEEGFVWGGHFALLTVTQQRVAPQRPDRLAAKRDQARAPPSSPPHQQHPFLEGDVGDRQRDQLVRPQPPSTSARSSARPRADETGSLSWPARRNRRWSASASIGTFAVSSPRGSLK